MVSLYFVIEKNNDPPMKFPYWLFKLKGCRQTHMCATQPLNQAKPNQTKKHDGILSFWIKSMFTFKAVMLWGIIFKVFILIYYIFRHLTFSDTIFLFFLTINVICVQEDGQEKSVLEPVVQFHRCLWLDSRSVGNQQVTFNFQS